MPKRSAGLLMVRRVADGSLEFLIAHPGGPLFARRDEGAWSLPKGLVDPAEDALDAARREFAEETGVEPVADRYLPLGQVRLKSGKVVVAWAFEGDLDPNAIVSNTFEMEWPRGSGRRRAYPEIDRATFADAATAKRKLNAAQAEFIDRAVALLSGLDRPTPA